MKNIFKKTVLVALIVALGAASLPLSGVSAMGAGEPPAPQGQGSTERLEKAWSRQLAIYEKIGAGFEREDAFLDKIQSLIDRAKSNGKDVTALQAALDAFELASKSARPVYESAKGIINSHQGFDENGKVADAEKAQATVKSMGEKLKQIKDAMGGAGKALREAMQAFREANPRPEKNTTPADDM